MSGAGSADLQRYRQGKKLTRGQAIRAKCADCLADYQDAGSRADCGISECPLYPFMPYAGKTAIVPETAPTGHAPELRAIPRGDSRPPSPNTASPSGPDRSGRRRERIQ
jgi:hypothetical protein